MSGFLAPLVITSVFGGVVSLDRTCFGQFMVSRPIVAAPLLGLLLGYPNEAVFIGLVYELLFLRSLPVGAHVPYHPLFPSLIAVLITAVTARFGLGTVQSASAAIVLSLPSAVVDRIVDLSWRRSNERLVTRATAYVRLEKFRAARAVHFISFGRSFLMNTVSLFLTGIFLVSICSSIFSAFPRFSLLLAGAGVAPFFVGLAGLTSGKVKGRAWLGFTCGLVAGVLISLGIRL
ncbi:MAG: PTS sugar transporter subunit IIC [bacterium]